MRFTMNPRGPGAIAVLLSMLVSMTLGSTALAQESTPGGTGESEIASQLPAADLPTMNEQGFVFELNSTWNGSFDNVPTEAPVYLLDAPKYDQDGAKDLATKLGIDGDVEDQGGGTYAVNGEGGSLFVTPGLQQFISGADMPDGDLPDDAAAVAFAREWLRQTNLLPPDAGNGVVVARVETPPRVVVSISPLRPENLLSAYPAITVTLGPSASILEASFRWADLSTADMYSLRPVDTAWTEVAERRSYLQADVPGDVAEPGSTVSGNAVYSTVEISYTTSGVPGETQYLQPVYVFTGKVTVEGSDKSYPITAYVPALVNSQQPVG